MSDTDDIRPAAPRLPRPQVLIYTDGACKGNPGPGGWGVWLRSGDHSKEMFGTWACYCPRASASMRECCLVSRMK